MSNVQKKKNAESSFKVSITSQPLECALDHKEITVISSIREEKYNTRRREERGFKKKKK